MGVDLPKIERKWQQRWEKEGAFQPKPDRKREKVLMAIPYPYTSGPLHIGHGRTYTLSDVWLRHRRMKGANALWPMGFHISGTPIVSVSKKIDEGDKATVELYSDYVRQYVSSDEVKKVIEGFRDPQKVADFFADAIIKDFRSLGLSVDWTRRFTTGDKDYNRFIEWQFLSLREKGLVKKGTHPVQYCPNCQSAVGEDDIRDGDSLDTSIQEYTAIKFPFKDGFLLAATLRPETIFGLTNLWVDPEARYCKVKAGNEIWYISRDAAEKLKEQAEGVRVLEEFDGKKLLWAYCSSPVERKEVPVLPASFVDAAGATGIVYSVPAHAPYDYIGLRDLQNAPEGAPAGMIASIKPVSIIAIKDFGEFPAKEVCESLGIWSQKDLEKLEEATKRVYREEFYNGTLKENCRQFSGTAIKDMKEGVKKWLAGQQKALKFFESATPGLVCRDGGKVFVKVIRDQWFIDYGNEEWKEKARECLGKARILPEHYRKLFEHTIDWLHERACARKRGLGTRLPWDNEWVIESLSDSTVYPAFYLVVREIRKNKIPQEALKPSFFDYVMLGKGDSGSVSKDTGIKESVLKEMRDSFKYWYPVDERHTAVGHITNHLTFYIFNHVALFDETKWPRSITLNEMVIREGAKMSKSRGNVIPLTDVSLRYSADLFRLYVVSAADIDSVLDWTEDTVESVRKRLFKIYSIADIAKGSKKTGMKDIDRWLLSRFNRCLRETEGLIEGYALRPFCQKMFFDVLNDLSHYLRRAGEPNQEVMIKVLLDWLKALSPIIPHACEELWEGLGQKPFVSLASWPKADEGLIDARSELKEELVRKVLEDTEEIKRIAGMEKPSRVTIYVSQSWKYPVYGMVKGGKQMAEVMNDPEARKQGNAAVQYAQSLKKRRFELSDRLIKEEELSALRGALEFLKRELATEVSLEDGDKSAHAKAKQAEPGKPGIFLG